MKIDPLFDVQREKGHHLKDLSLTEPQAMKQSTSVKSTPFQKTQRLKKNKSK